MSVCWAVLLAVVCMCVYSSVCSGVCMCVCVSVCICVSVCVVVYVCVCLYLCTHVGSGVCNEQYIQRLSAGSLSNPSTCGLVT